MFAGVCAGVSGRASECAGFWGLVGLAVAGFAGAGESTTRMFCVGLVVAGFAGVAAGFACAAGSTTEELPVGNVVAGFADVVADIAGVGEPRRACSLLFFLLRFVYQV